MQRRPTSTPKVTKSEASRALREAQRRYLDTVTARTGLTLTEVARKAGMSSSTLTRFMNQDGYEGTLAGLSISQIADATGISATSTALGLNAGGGFSESEAEPYVGEPASATDRALQALLGGRNAADPWVLRTHALEDAGYQPGDIVIVDLNASPESGDAVCAQIYDWDKMRAETVFRIFDAPYLIGATRDPSLRKPVVVDGKSVIIKGVVTEMLRPRRGGVSKAA